MGEAYLWIKVLHILAVISWMAGLFYLPRLFVYHVENIENLSLGKVFVVMEGRLLRVIMRPAAMVSVLAGVGLIWSGNWYGPVPGWLWAKVALLILLLMYHGALEAHAGRLSQGVESRSGRYFRILNEVPTVLLVFIVILVVRKPF